MPDRNLSPPGSRPLAQVDESVVIYSLNEGAEPKAIGVVNPEGVDYLGNPSTTQTLQADTTSPNAR